MKKLNILIPVITLCFISNMALADTFKPFVIAGVEFGGKELANIYDPITGERVNTIKAGEGLRLGVGVTTVIGKSMSFDTSVSYKFESTDIVGGDISFTVIPVDAIAYYHVIDGLRIGGGATYHINPAFQCNGVGCNADKDFDNGVGYIVSADFNYWNLITGIRYTKLKYSNVDASNFGLYVTVTY